MDKEQIRLAILAQLRADLDNAVRAANAAHDAATNEESKAENKYDTRGLEASYLAAGQSRRVQEIEQAITDYEQLPIVDFNDDSSIRLSALVTLEDLDENQRFLFIGPHSGGLKVVIGSSECTVVTPKAPLGQALMGRLVGDEVTINTTGNGCSYEIIAIL